MQKFSLYLLPFALFILKYTHAMEQPSQPSALSSSSSSAAASTPSIKQEKGMPVPPQEVLQKLFPVLYRDFSLANGLSRSLSEGDIENQFNYLLRIVEADARHRKKVLQQSKSNMRSLLNGLFVSYCYMNAPANPFLYKLKELHAVGGQSALQSLLSKSLYILPEDQSPLEGIIKTLTEEHQSSFEQPAPLLDFATILCPQAIPDLIALGANPSSSPALRLAIELYPEPIKELIEKSSKDDIEPVAYLACLENRIEWLKAFLTLKGHIIDPRELYKNALADNRGTEQDPKGPLIKEETLNFLQEVIRAQQAQPSSSIAPFKIPAKIKRQRTNKGPE
jgi:hypothetical protein